MMRGACAMVVVAAAGGLALVLPAAAHGPEDRGSVRMLFGAFDPARRTVLPGDQVTWTNTSQRMHTVTGRNGRFDSGDVAPRSTYVGTFTALGAHPYLCRIHPAMTGTVDVVAVLLNGPAGAVARGSQVELSGRTLPGARSVTIQEDRGSGFRTVSTATEAAGKFHALVRPQASTTYRALAGPHASTPVRVIVAPAVALSARGGRRRVRLAVRAPSEPPGATVVLQAYLRERFGWWPVARRRLDRRSRAAFRVRRRNRERRMRVLLTEQDGVTVRGVSDVVRVGRITR